MGFHVCTLPLKNQQGLTGRLFSVSQNVVLESAKVVLLELNSGTIIFFKGCAFTGREKMIAEREGKAAEQK